MIKSLNSKAMSTHITWEGARVPSSYVACLENAGEFQISRQGYLNKNKDK